MTARRGWLLLTCLLGLLGCGGPALRNSPRVNPAVVAAGAAAIAGAATLADPHAAARRQEQHKADAALHDRARAQEPSTTMPSELLDRLDKAEQSADGADSD
jgi:hypothetical protein